MKSEIRMTKSEGNPNLSALLSVPLLLCGCLLPSAFAATNDLASALQKGLFEEEANHNYPAAIEAYQGVINHFDEDRKLAATAIFRLGEIYRKQGKTNEANAQYERVVREFSDQSTLATLSQSYLATSTASSANAASTNVNSESAPTSNEAEEVKKIRAMIRDSPDLINARDPAGQTPLHRAAMGHLIVARFLLENGADPDIRDGQGQTPLYWAARYGYKAVVELLLSHGASVQIADSYGSTPLHAAAQKGFRSIVELLLAHGANTHAKAQFGSTPLHLAVANGFKSIAELLMNHQADVNPVTSDARDEQQRSFNGTPLQIAAARDDQALAELLLANKANPNATNGTGDTALHISATRGNQKLAELLLKNKADVDPINNYGETPLDFAAKNEKVELISLLLSHAAAVNFGNPIDGAYKDWTALHYAVAAQKKEAAALLLKNGADPNAKIGRDGKIYDPRDIPSPGATAGLNVFKGCTPLIMAAWHGDSDILAPLLDAKADPNLKDDRGLTPAAVTMHVRHIPVSRRVLSLLLEHGANTETRDIEGMTLLILAVERRDKEIVTLLLAHKADPNAKGPFDNTALHFVAQALNSNSSPIETLPDITEALLTAGANVNLQDREGKTALNRLLSIGPPSVISGPPRDKVIKLLQSHGAVTDLPRLDAIEVRRSAANFSKVIFTKGTNGWDQFTLFELIGVQYWLVTASPDAQGRSHYRNPTFAPEPGFAPKAGLDFPDFAHIRIRHPKPNQKGWDERMIDISTALVSGDCSSDISLELGDQVEIPEADHVLNAAWEGLSMPILATLKKCLTRQVAIVVKGQTNSFTLAPDYTTNYNRGGFDTRPRPDVNILAPFMIRPALAESNLLLASSDLAHIKLIRTDPATGEKRELIVDCSNGAPAPSVWLRDGDVIEVPDKP